MRAWFAQYLPGICLALIVLTPLVWGWRWDKTTVHRGSQPVTKRFNSLRGTDGRRSTSKLAAFTWLVAIAGAAAYLLTKVALSDLTLKATGFDPLNEQYLILMGTPLATLIISKGIVESKVNSGQLQKPEPLRNMTLKGDGFTVDEAGKLDVLDIQYLLFNAVLLIYFASSILAKSTVPELPSTLVGLTGVAAAAYVAGKAVSSNPPSITSVTTMPAAAGSTLVIRGQNLIKPAVEATADEQVALAERISVNGFNVSRVAKWETDGTLIEAAVDAGTPGSNTAVAVTTAADITVTAQLP